MPTARADWMLRKTNRDSAMPHAGLLAFATWLPLAATLSAAEPAPPRATMSASECEVWARELSFAQSVADHDAAAFAEHVDADAAFSAESPQPLRGREAIAKAWSSLVAGTPVRLDWYPARVTIAGADDIAVSSGPALIEDPRAGAKPRFRLAGFHSVWHRGADGAWRVLFDDGIAPRPATDAEVAAFHAGRQPVCPRG